MKPTIRRSVGRALIFCYREKVIHGIVKPGSATATGGMGCMGASLFQPTLTNLEVLQLSLEWIKTINKENKKCIDKFIV